MTGIAASVIFAFVAWVVWKSEEPFWAKPLAVVSVIYLLIGVSSLYYG